MGQTVCDQNTRYFESRGEVRHPRQMFQADLLRLIRSWKTAGDEIILMGDFNENVYEGNLARNLLHEDIRMSQLCQHMTGHSYPRQCSDRRHLCNSWYIMHSHYSSPPQNGSW